MSQQRRQTHESRQFEALKKSKTKFEITFEFLKVQGVEEEEEESDDEEDASSLINDFEASMPHSKADGQGGEKKGSKHQALRTRTISVLVLAFRDVNAEEPTKLQYIDHAEMRVRGPVLFTQQWWHQTVTVERRPKPTGEEDAVWTFRHVPTVDLVDNNASATKFISTVCHGLSPGEWTRYLSLWTDKTLSVVRDDVFRGIYNKGLYAALGKVPGPDRDRYEGMDSFVKFVVCFGERVPHELGALESPHLARFAGTLFRKQAGDVLSAPIEVKERMEAEWDREPWTFGFGPLVEEEFGLRGVEAQLRDLEHAVGAETLRETAPKDIYDALLVYFALKHAVYEEKSTYISQSLVRPYLVKKHGLTLHNPDLEPALDFLTDIGVVVREIFPGMDRLFLPAFYEYEWKTAEMLHDFVIGKRDSDDMVGDEEELPPDDQREISLVPAADHSGPELCQEQLVALERILQQRLTILCGGAGCGKTHVVSRAIGRCDPDEVLLSAFTAKASLVLSEKAGESMEGHTLHHILASYKSTLERSLPWRYERVRVLVIDELSFVPLRLFYHVVSLLVRHAKLQKIILVGDVNQLPSIEPGCLMRDLCTALQEYTVYLTENHRSDSADIAHNAQRCLRLDPYGWRVDPSSTCFSVDTCLNPFDLTMDNAKKWLQGTLTKFDPETSQCIAFKKDHVRTINAVAFEHRHQERWTRGAFGIGDKVACGRNIKIEKPTPADDHLGDPPDADGDGEDQRQTQKKRAKKREKEKEEEEEELPTTPDELVNGQMYKIEQLFDSSDRPMAHKLCSIYTNNATRPPFSSVILRNLSKPKELISLDRALFRRARFDQAYAKTIYTFQGCEIPHVIYVLSGSSFETSQHCYTSITRGIKSVTVMGSCLHNVVTKEPSDRKTALADRIFAEKRRHGNLPSQEGLVSPSVIDSQGPPGDEDAPISEPTAAVSSMPPPDTKPLLVPAQSHAFPSPIPSAASPNQATMAHTPPPPTAPCDAIDLTQEVIDLTEEVVDLTEHPRGSKRKHDDIIELS